MEHANRLMQIALDEAKAASNRGEVPVGCVIADGNGNVLSKAGNRTRELCDASAHAEILALRDAEKAAGDFRLDHIEDASCVVTIEPCLMCLGALYLARVKTIVFGARDEKFGGLYGKFFLSNHAAFRDFKIIEGVYSEESQSLLKNFFDKLRAK